MVPSDGQTRLDMEALARAVSADRAAGFKPIAVCANAGTASTGAIDPLEAVADFCEAEGIWLHVDASYGGFAVVTEQGKEFLRGIERADSIGLDAHKWFFQPYEAGCLLVRDERTLENVFSVHHDVLQDTIWGANHPNFADRSVQLSRSFRALKVWMSIQTFGLGAFRRAILQGMQFASRAEEYIRASSVLEIVNPVTLGDRVFPDPPGGRGPFRGSPGRDQPECARPCLLGRPCHHLVDDHPGYILSQAVHPQQRHDLGRRSPDPGGHRTIRRRGVIPASLRIRPVGVEADRIASPTPG